MFTKLTFPALALLVAAPAFGATQLERSIGVEPGTYTLSELTAIASAETEREASRLKVFFLEDKAETATRAAVWVSSATTDASIHHPGWDDR